MHEIVFTEMRFDSLFRLACKFLRLIFLLSLPSSFFVNRLNTVKSDSFVNCCSQPFTFLVFMFEFDVKHSRDVLLFLSYLICILLKIKEN